MSILVCPLSKVEEMIDAHVPERIVSVLDPGSTFPDSGLTYQGRHLRLSFHDLHEPVEGQVMPSTRDIDRLLEFLAGWPRTRPILAHCRAGVGRSPATAYIAACLHNPKTPELVVAAALRRVSPHARPNETLVGLADRAMGRGGMMCRAIVQTGSNLPWFPFDQGEPFEMPSEFDRT